MAYFSGKISYNQVRTKRGTTGLESHSLKSKFKKINFVGHDYIKPFT